MDKHDKHNKPGKHKAKPGAAPAKTEAPVAVAAEKGKGDWPGKQDGKKTR